MGQWNHAICEECWKKRKPGEEPVRIIGLVAELCCFCGNPTLDGIYVRQDPKKTFCKGEAAYHKKEEEENVKKT